MRRVDWCAILGNLRKQPIEEVDREERVPLEAVLAQRDPVAQDLDLNKPCLPSRLDQRLLRKRTGESAGVRGFVFKHLFGQASVHHGVGEDEPAAGTQDP